MKIFDKIKTHFKKDESIEQWAKRTGQDKKIEKLYNPTNPLPEDKEYLDQLHSDDIKKDAERKSSYAFSMNENEKERDD